MPAVVDGATANRSGIRVAEPRQERPGPDGFTASGGHVERAAPFLQDERTVMPLVTSHAAGDVVVYVKGIGAAFSGDAFIWVAMIVGPVPGWSAAVSALVGGRPSSLSTDAAVRCLVVRIVAGP